MKLIALLFLTSLTAQAVERVLMDAGRSDYEIVISADANPATMLAVKELRTWLKASTGVELALVNEAMKGRKHVFVGAKDFAAGLKAEGYRLKTIGDDIHIAGVDVHRGSLEPKRTSSTQTGTLSGVIDLLERCAGIRFFWHDALGTIVPKQERIIVPDLDITAEPEWKYRWLAYSPEGKCGDDMFARRLRLGHSHTVTHSHAWHQIAPVEKFGKEHPEWFAEIHGVRKPAYYLERHGGQVCTTNAEVIDLFANAAITYFNEHPERDMFSVSPNDGSGFCTCVKCKALDHGASLTDRLITFYNAIAEKVSVAHPTKLLGAYAYSFYREPPVKVKPHDSLYLVHATNSAFHQGSGWPEEREMEQQWRTTSKHLAKYDIYYAPDSSLNLIAPVTQHLIEKIHSETQTGFEGGYLYIGQSYEQLGPAHVLLAKLMWDAEANTEAIIADYFDKLYGDAAKDVRAYYGLLEHHLIAARSRPLDMSIPAIRLAWQKHPGPGSPAWIMSAYYSEMESLGTTIDRARQSILNKDEQARMQRLVDQHELIYTTLEGMYTAARLETEAESSAKDAKKLLALISQREAVRVRLKAYAPSLCASLDLADKAETETLAPSGPLSQLAQSLLSGQSIVRPFKRDGYRSQTEGGATLTAEAEHLRVQVPAGGTCSITFAIEAKEDTSYRITHRHWNDPAPAPPTITDDADATTRGEPPMAPRTRVIFRDAKGKAVTRNNWSGIPAHEHLKAWHTFPHFIRTPPGTKSLSFTLFLHHPGTYLIDDVKIEELGGVK